MPENKNNPDIEVSHGANGIDSTILANLAKEYGTPLLVMSENRLIDNYQRLESAFKKNYGNIAIKYAIKANSNPAIIRTLSGLGAGMDASSVPEIEIALGAGVDRNRIMFSPNYASRSELEFALNAGLVINFDDIGQFRMLSDIGVPDCVSFRLNPGFGKGEFPGITLSGPESKFGIPTSHILEAYKAAKDSGVKRFGMHMMCGSNVLDAEYFAIITSKILDSAGALKSKLGITPEFIDIGGGFGVPYKPEEKPLDIQKTAELVSREFKEKSEKYGLGGLQLMMEPGRYIVADTTVLLGTVNYIKEYEKMFIGTDIGMNLLLRPALYGAYHDISVITKPGAKASITADVVGEVCENTDAIARNRMLPRVSAGDIISVANSGAYVYGMSSQYNGRPRPAEVMVKSDGNTVLIRRRETTKDLLSTTVI